MTTRLFQILSIAAVALAVFPGQGRRVSRWLPPHSRNVIADQTPGLPSRGSRLRNAPDRSLPRVARAEQARVRVAPLS